MLNKWCHVSETGCGSGLRRRFKVESPFETTNGLDVVFVTIFSMFIQKYGDSMGEPPKSAGPNGNLSRLQCTWPKWRSTCGTAPCWARLRLTLPKGTFETPSSNRATIRFLLHTITQMVIVLLHTKMSGINLLGWPVG